MINSPKQLHRRRKNRVWHATRRDEEVGGVRGWAQTMLMENNGEKGGAMAIVHWSCWSFNSDSKLPQLLEATSV